MIEAVRRVLPQGRTLPDELWSARHRGILVLLWAHAVVIPVYALVRGFPMIHAVAEGLIIPSAAVVATSSRVQRRVRTLAASFGLLSSSAVLVHLSGGLIEMHFHFFVMVAVVALYQDWLPFLTSIGYVLIHHGLLGALDPRSVFNHPAAINSPWKWASIHAFFVAGISAACLVTWRLNETMLARRREAEENLRREKRIVETLHEVGQSLAAELDLQTVLQRVTDAGTTLSGAAYGAFFYNVTNESGESYLLYTLAGATTESFEGFGMPRNTPLFEPTFSGREVVRLDDVRADPRYGKVGPHYGMPKGHLPVVSYLAVPVTSRTGQVHGGLFFAHPQPGVFGLEQERICTGIAAHAAVALDNALLYESQRKSRTQAEEATRRMSLVAEAGRVLSSTLEPDEILGNLARMLVPAVADACMVDLLADDGSIRRVAAECADEAWGLAGPAGVAPNPDDTGDLAVRAVRSGTTQVQDRGSDPQFASSMVVPMKRRGETLGAVTLGRVMETGRSLSSDDVPLIEELVRRAAVAVENARLYQAQRDLAETLQHSLLPEELPDIPGVATAARYIPGGPGVEVGGDWYDVIELSDGTFGLAMGDVVGRGVPAASLMGQLRNALRAYSVDESSPSQVVTRVNSLLHGAPGFEQMATLVYAVFDPQTGVLTLANAGHPPPLVLGPDGSADWITGAKGAPLGASRSIPYGEATVSLKLGSTIVLYTDGLVEDRETPLDDGLDALLKAALGAGECDVSVLCEEIIKNSKPSRLGRDDTALLALRYLPMENKLSMHLASNPGSLRQLRAAVRRWLGNAGANEQEAFEILAAIGEACANAIQHSLGSQAATFDLEAERNGDVRVAVRNRGSWRPPRPSDWGRGLKIMRAFMDDVEIRQAATGIEVVMRRSLTSREMAG